MALDVGLFLVFKVIVKAFFVFCIRICLKQNLMMHMLSIFLINILIKLQEKGFGWNNARLKKKIFLS